MTRSATDQLSQQATARAQELLALPVRDPRQDAELLHAAHAAAHLAGAPPPAA